MLQFLTPLLRCANWPILILLLALPACSGAPWQKEFWHPPAASGTEPIREGPVYPIARASGENLKQGWPNLGDIPPKPDMPMDAATEAEQLKQLEADRAAAHAAKLMHAADGAALTVPDQSPQNPPELGK